MRGSKLETVNRPDRARILPPREREPSLKRGGQGAGNRSLVIALAMIVLMLGGIYSALPTSMHNLSPADPTHASLHEGSAGEGPISESRTVSGQSSFLNIEPTENFLGIDPDGLINATFEVEERNNVVVFLSSYRYRILYLDDTILIPYNGGKSIDVTVPALGEAEITVLMNVPDQVTFDLMKRGIDKLKIDLGFRGADGYGSDINVVVRAPLHILQRVAMIVDEDVYPFIKDNLARYEQDVLLKNKAEFIYAVDSWTTPEQVRNALKKLWTDEGITGAILWGYLPVPMWSMVHSDNSTEDFPIPIFYEDLDGSFEDLEGDGLYDRHYWGDNDGAEIWVSHVMPPRPLVPSTNLDPRGEGTGGGLVGNYYNTRNMNNFKLNRVDPTLDFYWVEDLPKQIDDDDFSIQWTGRIKADETERYTFSPHHGGIGKIWIDGNLLHDRTIATWHDVEWLFDVTLTKGWHNIRIEYNNGNWGFKGTTRLMWTSDSLLANSINEWLDKTHAYHNGEMEYNERALLFMDYGYGTVCRMADPIFNKQIKPLYGDDVVVKGLVNTTSADDYLDALEDGYELVSVWSHAGSAGHHINAPAKDPEANSTAPSWRIRETEANVVTLIWGCHAGDYGNEGPGTSYLSDNLAVNYAFATPNGLACAAATRSIGTGFKNIYWAWDNGSSLGTGFLAYLEEEYDRDTIMRKVPNLAEDMWVKDVVLMGDPFLRIDHRPWNLSMEIDAGSEFTASRDVTLHMSSIDAEEMRFRNAGGPWSPWEAYNPSKEWQLGTEYGAARVVAQVRNDWGQAEYSATDVITRVATMSDRVSVQIEEGAEMTTSSNVDVTLDIGTADPGLVWMSLCDERGVWSDWAPFTSTTTWTLSPGDGDRTVEARFVADDQIWRAGANDSIVLDTRAPVTTSQLEGQMNRMEWYTSNVSITLDASDSLTGLDWTEWSLDGGDWTYHSGTIPVAGDGEHQLMFRSCDVAGNLERTSSTVFKIDQTAPDDLSIEMEGGGNIIGLPSLDIVLAANDHTSGVEAMRFSIDGDEWGPWINFEGTRFMAIPSEEGEHTISWQVRDMAGNVATDVDPLVVILDKTSPMVSEVEPADASVDVPVDTNIRIVFTEAMDIATVTIVNVLVQDTNGIPVVCTLEMDGETGEVTITPSSPLKHFTTYSIMLRGDMSDLAGNSLNGGTSHIWTFTTVGVQASAPRNMVATATNTSIGLTWELPEELGSGDFEGYNLYRMKDLGPGNAFEFLTFITGTGYEDSDVVIEVQYHYMVTAVTSYSDGKESNVASAIIIPVVEEPVDEPEEPEIPGPNNNGDDSYVEAGPSFFGSSVIIIIAIIVAAMIGSILYLRRSDE